MKLQNFFVDENRWCKRTSVVKDKQGNIVKACLVGALVEGYFGGNPNCGIDVEFKKIRQTILNSIEKLFPARYTGLILQFNDHPDTKIEDIRVIVKDCNL